MEWFFENLGKFVTFIIFIVYILSSLRGKGVEEEEDPEALERARKIQEEIRRRILERQQGAQPSEQARREFEEPDEEEWLRPEAPAPASRYDPHRPESEQRPLMPAPTFYGEPERPQPVRPSVIRPRVPEIVFEKPEEDIFETQRRAIEDQLAKADALRRKMGLPRSAPADGSILGSRTDVQSERDTAGHLRARLLRGLSDQRSLRGAVLLKEVLDKPVGLR